jgi:hypothetical protein
MARELAGKPSPVAFTENGTDPISFPLVGNSLDLIWHTSARRATRAAQQLEKALKASEPRSSNLRGYTDPVRSAQLPAEANKIMTRFAGGAPS